MKVLHPDDLRVCEPGHPWFLSASSSGRLLSIAKGWSRPKAGPQSIYQTGVNSLYRRMAV